MNDMTVKELADVAGVSENTIHRAVNELMPGYMVRGRKAVFNKEQAFDIMAAVRKKNLVSTVPRNGEVVPHNGDVVPVMAKMMEMLIVLTDKMAQIQTGQLHIEAPKQDYYSLIGYCGMKGIKTRYSELSGIGMKLRQMTLEAGFELRRIPDERWGQVNSYPVEILEEYFTL